MRFAKPFLGATALVAALAMAGSAAAFSERLTRRAAKEAADRVEECAEVVKRQVASCMAEALEDAYFPNKPDYRGPRGVYRDAAKEIEALVDAAVASDPGAAAPTAEGGRSVDEDLKAVPPAQTEAVNTQAAAIVEKAKKALLASGGSKAKVHHARLAAPLDKAKSLLLS